MHNPTEQFYTSDYDLPLFTSQMLGIKAKIKTGLLKI